MIDPLVQKQPSRKPITPFCSIQIHGRLVLTSDFVADAMFAAFMKSINDAQADIKEFTELMRDEASREVFDHVNKSEAEKPYGIKAWRHKDHPDWFRMDKQS